MPSKEYKWESPHVASTPISHSGNWSEMDGEWTRSGHGYIMECFMHLLKGPGPTPFVNALNSPNMLPLRC